MGESRKNIQKVGYSSRIDIFSALAIASRLLERRTKAFREDFIGLFLFLAIAKGVA